MNDRQSGAAHVPMMFFLLLLAMFLGALGFAYVTFTENGKLNEELKTAKATQEQSQKKALLVDHYIDDLGRVLGKPGKYEGRDGQTAAYGGATLESTGVVNPKEIKKVLDDACATAGVSSATGIENVLGAMVTRINQTNQRTKDIEAERDKALAEKAEIDTRFQAATNEHSTKVRELGQNLDQVRSDFETAKLDKDRRIGTLEEGLRAKTDELSTANEASASKEKALNQQMAKIRMHNDALVSKTAMINAVDTADGKVIAAQQGVPTAFINLGKKDMLQPGTVFRIRNPHSSVVKAHAVVTRVEEERSAIELSDMVDPVGDFVRAGDELYNEIYTPRATRTIYLLGRFQAPYNKPELTALLKRLGNKVVDKMGPGVDTVILGNDPINEAADGFDAVTNSADYKLALDLRVEFAYLKNIRDLIKL